MIQTSMGWYSLYVQRVLFYRIGGDLLKEIAPGWLVERTVWRNEGTYLWLRAFLCLFALALFSYALNPPCVVHA